MEFKFDAVFNYVSDLGRAIRFYTDGLGFRLHSCDYVARFYLGDVLFELVPTDDAGKLEGGGNARLCLEVDDIQAAIAELRAKGITVANSDARDNGLLSFFRDPDGNEIAAWQYTR